MKKILICALAALLMMMPTGAFASQTQTDQTGDYDLATGEVTDVRVDEVSGVTYLTVTLSDGSPAVLAVDKDTFQAGGEAAKGGTVTGWYDRNAPMTMIYPPQYHVIALAAGLPEGLLFTVDRFDTDLLGSNGQLKLNIDETVPVEQLDGTAFEGDLGGCTLAVYYSTTTRSIPPQTTPSRVVVLAEAKTEAVLPDLTKVTYLVGGNKVEAPAPFYGENNVVMVPLRPLADALKLDYQYDAATGKGTVGGVAFENGERLCTKADSTQVQLEAAPVLSGDEVYVSLSFFHDAAGLANAYLSEGQIVIDDAQAVG